MISNPKSKHNKNNINNILISCLSLKEILKSLNNYNKRKNLILSNGKRI